MRPFFLSLLAFCLMVSGLSYADTVLAFVGDEVITLYDLQKMTKREEEAIARQYAGKVKEEHITQYRRAMLDTMIERELAYLEFVDLKAKLPQNIVQDRLNEIIQSRAAGNVAKFEDQLMAEGGMTIKEFRQKLTKDISIEMLIRDKISRGNMVSDAEVEAYYQAHLNEMVTLPSYHIAVIQLSKNGKYAGRADKVYAEIMGKLREGIPFEELAKTYSEGANAENGGDQGWMPSLHEKLYEIVKDLAPGQTASKIANLGNNFYIVHLIDAKKGGTMTLDKELQSKIRALMLKQNENQRYKDFMRELYMKYPVKRFDGGQ